MVKKRFLGVPVNVFPEKTGMWVSELREKTHLVCGLGV
jgi:hypothetical protein